MKTQIIKIIEEFLEQVNIETLSKEEETPYLIQQMYNKIADIIDYKKKEDENATKLWYEKGVMEERERIMKILKYSSINDDINVTVDLIKE